MALAVFLKGINVGGHRTFRPTGLARALKRYEVANVGAAGTFVVRGRVARGELRAEIVRRLPFPAVVMICSGRDLLELVSTEPFAGQPDGPQIVRFVSLMSRNQKRPPRLPRSLPTVGRWGLRVLERRGPFILGLYRREMKAIGYLGQLERLVGVPLATRSWTTIQAVVKLLED